MPDPLAERSRDWYEAHAGRYDRRHPGLPGDVAFYAALADGATVLEIGAGTGRVTAALAVVAGRVVAVEIAPAMLRRAAGRLAGLGNVALLLADARRLPLAGTVDLIVIAYRTLHHFDSADRAQLWRSLAALVGSRGQIAFDTWHGPVGRGSSRGQGPPSAAIDEAAIRSEIAAAGLRVTGVAPTFGQGPGADSFTRVWLVRGNTRS